MENSLDYINGVLDTLNLLRMKLPVEQAKGLAHYGTDLLHKNGLVIFDTEDEKYILVDSDYGKIDFETFAF